MLVDRSTPEGPCGQRLGLEIGRNFAAYALPGIGERPLRQRRARLGSKGMVAQRKAVYRAIRVPVQCADDDLTAPLEASSADRLAEGDAVKRCAESKASNRAPKRGKPALRREAGRGWCDLRWKA